MLYRGYKFRLYATDEQEELFSQFAKVYMAEKRLLLDALRPAVSGWPNATPLLERAERVVSDYFNGAGRP